jgi:serine/threonine protein kinase
MTYNITNKLLGKGGFGSVFLCNTKDNKSYAVKCCEVKKDIGISFLLEPIIMATISHPHLNCAERINASEKNLYIIQELALTDLAQYTRFNKQNYQPSLELLKTWTYSIMKAISALHDNNIIHCDIKANNILLYPNDVVKLADFSLSVLKSHRKATFSHKICVISHRPLEVLMKKSWNEAVDIWSLGCTLYEIAYGKLLFPCQNNKGENKNECYINAILEWDNIVTDKNMRDSSFLRLLNDNNMYPIEYSSPTFCLEANDLSKIVFNDLLHKILISDQNKRPNIKTLLEHPFIKNLNDNIVYTLVRCKSNTIDDHDKNIIINYMKLINDDDDVLQLSFKIYCCVDFILSYSQKLKAFTCTVMACKLTHTELPFISEDILTTILDAEREICNNISYHITLK